MCLNDVTLFKLHINEPETQRKMEFDMLVEACFLEEELANGLDLRNVAHLKRMARVLVEERAVIKRVGKGEEGGENYTVEVNLSGVIPMQNQVQAPSSRTQTPTNG